MTAPVEGDLVRVPGCLVCQRLDLTTCLDHGALSRAARAAAGAKFTIEIESRRNQVLAARRRHERSRQAFADHLRTEHDIDVAAAVAR